MSWADLGLPDAPEPSGNETPAPRPRKEPKPSKEPKPPKTPKPPKPPRESGGQGDGEGGSRTPLILGIVAGVLLVAVVVTLGFALTRGSSTASPADTPSSDASTAAPTAQPSPSPSASSDAVGVPVALKFGGTGFTLVDKNAKTVFSYEWRDKAADAVTELTAAFGAAPTQRVEPGDGSSYPDYTVYQWEGFLLYDMVDGTGGAQRATFTQPSYATFSRNEVGPISMTAEHGLKIGSPVTAVRAAGPSQEVPRGNVGSIRFIFDQSRSSAGPPVQYSMIADTDGSTVTAVLYYFAAGG